MNQSTRGGKRMNAGRKLLNSKIVQFSIPAIIFKDFKNQAKLLKQKLLKKQNLPKGSPPPESERK